MFGTPRAMMMAKHSNDKRHAPRPDSSLRVRWVEVEVNGADTTIEEALRTVERMRRPSADAPPSVRRIAHAAAADNAESAPPEATLFDEAGKLQAGPDGTNSSADADVDNEVQGDLSRRRRGEGNPKDRNAGIELVGDLDFVPSDKTSLKAFFAQKAPGSDMDQILALCYYLQYTLECQKFGPGHVLTGFKHVSKPVPKDLKQTIRNMKKKAWLNFTDIENIRLTTEGENRVEHELGKGDDEPGAH